MPHPFGLIENNFWLKLILAIVLAAGTGWLLIKLTNIGASLNTASAPKGMMSFYFAGRKIGLADEILKEWTPQKEDKKEIKENKSKIQQKAKQHIYWDFLFLLLYSTMLAFFCYLAVRAFPEYKVWVLAGFLLMYGQWLAALFDAIENTLVLIMVEQGKAIVMLPQLTLVMATLKWALVIFGIAYSITGLWMWIVNKFSG